MGKLGKNKELSRFEMTIFAAGDIYGGGGQIIISFFYLIFLTDYVKIQPALAGTVILISKVWDAVNDPLMGFITDNTRSRWGRRKPYFLVGFFAILAAYFLLWYPISHESEFVRFAYVLVTYLLYSTVSTIVAIPYAAMSSEITQDYKKRNSVNGLRLIFSQCSSLICAVLPLEIVKLFEDPKEGYIAMSLSFGLLFSIPFILMFFFTHERVPLAKEKSKFSIKEFLAPFKVKSFRYLIFMYLFAFMAMDVVSTVFAYYMNYFLKRPSELNYVLGAMLITQIILIPAVIAISNRVGKARTYMYSAIIWAIGIVVLSVQSTAFPPWAIYVNAVLIGIGLIGCIVLPWVMYPDVADVGELYAGKRNAGSFSGIMTFMRNISSAFAIFIVSYILQFSGYVKPASEVVNGVTKTILMDQPSSLIWALKGIVVGVPLIALFIASLAAKKYPLSRERHELLMEYLKFQRGESKESPLKEKELETLKSEII
ncbi:MAG: MFS transporter [Anaerolineaceae bacterium]|nr:MAG: MFS transporter [Anaerolineaceae bacterium]